MFSFYEQSFHSGKKISRSSKLEVLLLSFGFSNIPPLEPAAVQANPPDAPMRLSYSLRRVKPVTKPSHATAFPSSPGDFSASSLPNIHPLLVSYGFEIDESIISHK
jgi:hypothetical protein